MPAYLDRDPGEKIGKAPGSLGELPSLDTSRHRKWSLLTGPCVELMCDSANTQQDDTKKDNKQGSEQADTESVC